MTMTRKPKHIPASKLPWKPMPQYSPIAPYIQSEKDEDYACHAANAYPKLVEALWHVAGYAPDASTRKFANEILTELGEENA